MSVLNYSEVKDIISVNTNVNIYQYIHLQPIYRQWTICMDLGRERVNTKYIIIACIN